MSPEAVVVVGDRFTEFLTNQHTVGISQLLADLVSRPADTSTPIVLGQGLSARELDQLREKDGVQLLPDAAPTHIERALTHKRIPKNVLIGPIVQTADKRFAAPILIDEEVDVLEDHLTGQHIPAITLLEAARQSWTSLLEAHLLAEPGLMRFVIKDLQASFERFVFPLPAWFDIEVSNVEPTSTGTTFEFVLRVRQNQVATTLIGATVLAIPEIIARKQEGMAARQAVRENVNRPEVGIAVLEYQS